VAYASQTGFAESLADEAAQALRAAGLPVRLLPLGQLGADELARTEQALFIVSTCGEGDAPDRALPFVGRVMAGQPTLTDLHYGLLALGDRSYANFCGFGRRLDAWLHDCGARPMFPRLDLDRADQQTLRHWRHALGHVAGTADLPDWRAPGFQRWRIAERRLLNPGSVGLPTFHVEMAYAAPDGDAPAWEAGDLLQVCPPDYAASDGDRPREYSIASLPAHGRVHLLVRQQRDAHGRLGRVSGWLTEGAPVGTEVAARLRRHGNFRVGDNADRPLILIGNGTGLAGLMAHLRQRAQRGEGRNWLIFGERNAAQDFYYRDEIADWQRQGMLARFDPVFSRDGSKREYVQHRVAAEAGNLRAWIANGAALYVCGNAVGMAPALDAVLSKLLGRECLDGLIAAGRYRRDLY
ncbi:MAG: flavodoxin domain-containing protein, partial [Ectothiorhodospiraceae bacterium]|nr:flavodoxin domain-containing protein [Ectothiorhodospiraceae bacterium]